MNAISCNLIRSTAAVCLLIVSGAVRAEDGLVRITDSTSSGVVRISDGGYGYVRPVSFSNGGAECCAPQTVSCGSGCTDGLRCPMEGCNAFQRDCVACQPCCTADGCQSGGCDANGCYVCCGNCPCCGTGRGCNGQCGNPCCTCNGSGSFGDCYDQRMNCLFAGSVCSGTGCKARDWYRGQSLSFQAKNARLANHLFGWMVPSGCCGQGCPPVGKYQITYADQPSYADPRDGQLYAAQGYGIPMTVPIAPNVHYTYNYSSGLPSSRLTPLSNYNPATSPQPLYHQSW